MALSGKQVENARPFAGGNPLNRDGVHLISIVAWVNNQPNFPRERCLPKTVVDVPKHHLNTLQEDMVLTSGGDLFDDFSSCRANVKRLRRNSCSYQGQRSGQDQFSGGYGAGTCRYTSSTCGIGP